MKKQQGFTLIEIMVVMAIIAVLATAGLSSYAWYIARATDSKTEALLANLVSATLQLKADSPDGATPTKEQIEAYIALNPSLSHTSLATLPDIFGISKAFAQTGSTLAHPAGDRAICIGKNALGEIVYNVTCEIVYYRFSDGKFAFSGGVRTKAAMRNFHRAESIDNARTTFGAFVGTSPVVARTEELLSDALVAYSPTVTVVAEGLTPVTSYIPPETSPVSSTTYPPISSDPNPEVTEPPYPTDPFSTTEYNNTTDYPTNSWWEETTTEYNNTTDYPTISWWEETTTEYGTTEYPYPTTSWWGEGTTDWMTTSWGEMTTEVPMTTEGGAWCVFDFMCPESQYCDGFQCRNQAETEQAISISSDTSTPSGSAAPLGENYCSYTIFKWNFWERESCIDYSSGLPTGQLCYFDSECTIGGSMSESSSTTDYGTTSWGEISTDWGSTSWGETTTGW